MLLRKSTIKIVLFLSIFFAVYSYAHAAIVIDEVMYDLPGIDTGKEWIEVANTGTDAVDMTGWKLFENNTNHGLMLTQGNATISAGGFAIIADTPQKFLLDWPEFSGTIFDSTFSLSNTGEQLELKDNQGNIADTLTYDTALGAGGDGNTLQLISTGWTAKTPTVGTVNEPSSSPPENQDPPPNDTPPPADDPVTGGDDSGNTDTPPQDPGDSQGNDGNDGNQNDAPSPIAPVSIDEIAWMGIQGDQYGEWLELYNAGDTAVDLNGWKLYKDDGTTLIFTLSKTIAAKGYLVIERTTGSSPDPLSWINDESGSFGGGSLANLPCGEFLVLKDSLDSTVQSLDFSSGWPAGNNDTKETMQLIDGVWVTALATPGATNVPSVPKQDSGSSQGGTATGGGSASSNDDVAPALVEEVSASGAASPSVSSSTTINAAPIVTRDFSQLILSIVKDDEGSYVQIENPTGDVIDISGTSILCGDTSFVISEHTMIAAGASIVIANANARFAGANRAVWVDDKIVVS